MIFQNEYCAVLLFQMSAAESKALLDCDLLYANGVIRPMKIGTEQCIIALG